LPVHLLDDRGQVVSETAISFVSPSVDGSTQSVLAKALVDPPGAFRTDQFVRAQIVWTEAASVTAPIVALNRINGQFFAYVAEPGEGGALVARQRAVEPGSIVGNDYVVKSGLRPGEKLIVSGVQKIRDGAPVQATVAGASPAAPAAAPAGGKGR
jgi:multidrug efflux pump subunit AcrA (membrane-fusion protein)